MQRSCINILIINKETGEKSLSIYKDELTNECFIKQNLRVKQSFPALSNDFFDVFIDRIKENGFTDQRLKDAVNFVVDNCVYPTPTIAQFISFDKRIKVLNYHELTKINDETCGNAFKYYASIKVDGFDKPLYAKIEDIAKYNLTRWEAKNGK